MKKGFGLIEVVIAAGILSLVSAALFGGVIAFMKASTASSHGVKASYLLEEGAETLKVFRDISWDNRIAALTNGSTYYLYWSAGAWWATTTVSKVDNTYYRSFSLGPVYRDANDDIASSGTLDVDTRKATVTVAWFDTSKNATSTKTLLMYLTDLFGN